MILVDSRGKPVHGHGNVPLRIQLELVEDARPGGDFETIDEGVDHDVADQEDPLLAGAFRAKVVHTSLLRYEKVL